MARAVFALHKRFTPQPNLTSSASKRAEPTRRSRSSQYEEDMQHNDFDPGPLAEVSRQDLDGRPILVFSRHVRHPPERVWVALTVPDELCKWAPFFPSRDLSQIGDATFRPTDT